MQQEVFLSLKKIPFLSRLPDEALNALAAKAKSVKFPKQAVIISEGDESSSLYIILAGKVRVFSSDEKSKEVTLLIQEAGSCFGELALLGDEPRSASVETLEKTVCGIISKDDFKYWLASHPDVAIGLIRALSEKIRQLTEKVKQMALSNVYERTIKVLQDMATQEGDIFIIHNKPTQQELANMVGSSREMINKIMRELTKGGYVVIKDKTLRIENKLPASW
ncbi:Crp/Fnr family transcriptional regulator [Candidatus Methylobacter favarea]|uniref:Crp/Fnr family transcriptional regulator n=1 Tax=Candidatus Methylobacter favarea TaxID=2707345 RepID=A0A8S0XRF2_9GAMM|nr:Crp/Fnr family transcriptional regulator [Candidatus Methylobacter favarea]CAA9889949.1 Crp/Fnr family transcriptional regulator [Candidatus Methylobacter favarea]